MFYDLNPLTAFIICYLDRIANITRTRLGLRLQWQNHKQRRIVRMKRECDVDHAIAAKHAKATNRPSGVIKVEFEVKYKYSDNEFVSYNLQLLD